MTTSASRPPPRPWPSGPPPAASPPPSRLQPPAPAAPPAFTALSVEGNRIVDADGADVVLRGVAVVDPLVGRGIRYHSRLGEQDLETLAREWRASIVRVPMHPDLMAHHPAYLRRLRRPPGRLGRRAPALPAAGLPRPRQPAHRRGGGHPLGLRSALAGEPLQPRPGPGAGLPGGDGRPLPGPAVGGLQRLQRAGLHLLESVAAGGGAARRRGARPAPRGPGPGLGGPLGQRAGRRPRRSGAPGGHRLRDPPLPVGGGVLEAGRGRAVHGAPRLPRGVGVRRRAPGERAQLRRGPRGLLRGAGSRLDGLDLGPLLDAEHVHLPQPRAADALRRPGEAQSLAPAKRLSLRVHGRG